MAVKELKIDNLYGEFYYENLENPIIIMAHGFGSAYLSGIPYAEAFLKAGYNTYVFDFYGCSATNKSGGHSTEISVLTLLNDLNQVVDYFKENYHSKLILYGTSLGGLVSAITAARRDDIALLLLNYPAFSLKEDMRKMFPKHIPHHFEIFGIPLSDKFAKDVYDFDIDMVYQYQNPVLILHGNIDEIVPIQYSRNAIKKYNNATLVEYDQVGHRFKTMVDIVSQDVIKFLKEKLK